MFDMYYRGVGKISKFRYLDDSHYCNIPHCNLQLWQKNWNFLVHDFVNDMNSLSNHFKNHINFKFSPNFLKKSRFVIGPWLYLLKI